MWKIELGNGAGEGVGRKEAIQAIALISTRNNDHGVGNDDGRQQKDGKTEVQFRGR